MLFVLEHVAGVYAVRARMSRRGLCCSCNQIPQRLMLFVLGCPAGVYDFHARISRRDLCCSC